SHGQPLVEDLLRLAHVHLDVAVLVVGQCRCDSHLLQPAVHPRHRIGLYREGEVLMHTGIVPRDPRRVGVLAVEGLYSFLLPQFPYAVGGTVEIDEAGDPPAAIGLVQSPAAHVVAERDNTRTNTLGDPDPYDEMPDTRGDPHELARCDTERLSVFAVDPE